MKKYYKAKAMRLVVSLSLIVCLLAGCGNSKTETSPEAATEETAVAEEATEAVKEEPAAEPKIKEEKAVAEESDDNETVSEEDTTEESDSADPGEVTYITDFTSIDDYMESLDMNTLPAIVIYNEQEGYIINMQMDQHYQLKPDDQILYNIKENEDYIGMYLSAYLGDGVEVYPNYGKLMLNYTKWNGEEENYFYKYEDGSEEPIGVICYLTPPTE
jgi:hypothetical protein